MPLVKGITQRTFIHFLTRSGQRYLKFVTVALSQLVVLTHKRNGIEIVSCLSSVSFYSKILCGQFCTEPPAAQNNPSIERAAVVSAKSRKQYLQLRYHILRANQFTHALFSKPLDELVMLKKF